MAVKWSTYAEARAGVQEIYGRVEGHYKRFQDAAVQIGQLFPDLPGLNYMAKVGGEHIRYMRVFLDDLGDGDWVIGEMILNDVKVLRQIHLRTEIIMNYADGLSTFAFNSPSVTWIAALGGGTEAADGGPGNLSFRDTIDLAHDDAEAFAIDERRDFAAKYDKVMGVEYLKTRVDDFKSSLELPPDAKLDEYKLDVHNIQANTYPLRGTSFSRFYLKTKIGPSFPTDFARNLGDVGWWNPRRDGGTADGSDTLTPANQQYPGMAFYEFMSKTKDKTTAFEERVYRTIFGLTVVGSTFNDYLAGYIGLAEIIENFFINLLIKITEISAYAMLAWLARTNLAAFAAAVAVLSSAIYNAVHWCYTYYLGTRPAFAAYNKNKQTLLTNGSRYGDVAAYEAFAVRFQKGLAPSPHLRPDGSTEESVVQHDLFERDTDWPAYPGVYYSEQDREWRLRSGDWDAGVGRKNPNTLTSPAGQRIHDTLELGRELREEQRAAEQPAPDPPAGPSPD
jgi:hypothetical protein